MFTVAVHLPEAAGQLFRELVDAFVFSSPDTTSLLRHCFFFLLGVKQGRSKKKNADG